MAPDLRGSHRKEAEERPRGDSTSLAGCDGENHVFVPTLAAIRPAHQAASSALRTRCSQRPLASPAVARGADRLSRGRHPAFRLISQSDALASGRGNPEPLWVSTSREVPVLPTKLNAQAAAIRSSTSRVSGPSPSARDQRLPPPVSNKSVQVPDSETASGRRRTYLKLRELLMLHAT
jgi:hypothetical protein